MNRMREMLSRYGTDGHFEKGNPPPHCRYDGGKQEIEMAVFKTIVFIIYILCAASATYFKYEKENDEALWWLGWAIIFYMTFVSYGW